jgi:hypothetical protein
MVKVVEKINSNKYFDTEGVPSYRNKPAAVRTVYTLDPSTIRYGYYFVG